MKKLRHIKLNKNDWYSIGHICNLIKFDTPTIITGIPDKNYIVLCNENPNIRNNIDLEAIKKSSEIDIVRVNSDKPELLIGPVFMSKNTLDWQIKNLKDRKKILSSFAKVLNRNGVIAHLRESGSRNDLVVEFEGIEYKILGILDTEKGFSGMLTLKWDNTIPKKYIRSWKEKSSTGWNIKGLWQLTEKIFDIEDQLVSQIALDYNLEIKKDVLSEKELDCIKKIREYITEDDWIFKNIKNW